MKVENLPVLRIHKLTQEQYEQNADNFEPNALYLTEDTLEENLEKYIAGQNEWYYESIADVFNDISEKTLGEKALSWKDVEKATAKVGCNNGKLSVELLKNVDLGSADIILQWPLDLILNGYTLALGTIRLFGDNVRIFGGLTDGELIPVSSTANYGTGKKGVLKAVNGMGMSVCGKNCGVFGVDYMHLPTSLHSNGTIMAVTLTGQAGGAENFVFSNSSLKQIPQIKVESNQYGISSGALSATLQNCKIMINENGSSQCVCVLQQQGGNMKINDCEITGAQSKSLFVGVLCSDSLVSISKTNLNIEGACMGIRAQSEGIVYVNDFVTSDAGLNSYQISSTTEGQIYVDNFSSLSSMGIWSGGKVYLSNCSSTNKLQTDIFEDAGFIEIGAGCDIEIVSNNIALVFYTEKLYRKIDENAQCNGRDYEVLTDYLTGSILNQLEIIVEGDVQ